MELEGGGREEEWREREEGGRGRKVVMEREGGGREEEWRDLQGGRGRKVVMEREEGSHGAGRRREREGG